MANPNSGRILVDALDHMMRVSENPFHASSWILDEMLGLPRKTYRERLHREIVNYHGDVVPRIETVRENLRRLNNRRLDPNRIPS